MRRKTNIQKLRMKLFAAQLNYETEKNLRRAMQSTNDRLKDDLRNIVKTNREALKEIAQTNKQMKQLVYGQQELMFVIEDEL